MNSQPKISIIIPVYGVEGYIGKCIASIKQQTFEDFEVILINDGTKDNSVGVAETAIAGDKRFLILHKENGGQGSARNVGLDHARGDYIAFIDSDDYVEPRFLQAMYEEAIASGADVCTCNVRYVDSVGGAVRVFENDPAGYIKHNDYLMVKWFVSNFMWDKLFKRELFDVSRFDARLKTNEDVYLLFELLCGKKIVGVNEVLYNYLQRPQATSKGAPPTFISDRLMIVEKQFSFARSLGCIEEGNKYLEHVYLKHFLFNSVVTLSRYSKDFRRDVERLVVNLDGNYFSFARIAGFFRVERKVALSLLLFKMSPRALRLFARFWFRSHVA